MTTITMRVNDNKQNFIQSFENFVSNYNNVSFNIKEQKSISSIPKELYNSKIESFLTKEAEKNNLTVIEYLNCMIMYETEKETIKQDLQILENEIKQVNKGEIKLESADLLLNEL